MRTIRSFGLILMLTAVFIGFSPLAEAYVGGTCVTYTTPNSGLGSDDVRAICPDGLGNIWFGTANGLSKFDGVSWKTYTTADKLAHNMVNAIAYENGADGDQLWVGTDGGVTAVGVKPGVVAFSVPFTTQNTQYPGMISDKILAAAVDSQHVRWFGTDKGLMSFNGAVWKVYTTADKLAHNQVNAIAYEETKYGPEIWVATAGGISLVNTSIDAVTFATPFTTTNTKYPGVISDIIQSATMDSIHNMRWFGTDKGVIGFDGNVFMSFTMNDFLPDNDITSAAVGLNGMVYFGTRHGGVSRFDGVSGASPLDTMWSGIASNTIRAIAVGKFGALWFATDQGVTKWIPEGLGVDGGAEHPVAAAIRSVFPNPFNPSTTIEFSLARNGRAVLAVYNLSGQKVREFLSGAMSAGLHTVKWDGRDRNGAMVSSGAYIIQLRMDNTVVNRKIMLAK
jgi:ligand-binding sensor domain-containing protein